MEELLGMIEGEEHVLTTGDDVTALSDEAPSTPLERYRRAVLERIARLQEVLSPLYEVIVSFPAQVGTGQSMRIYSISTVEPDMLVFNGLQDNHTPASVMVQSANLTLMLTTRKRFDPGQRAMTAFGFKNEQATDWS